MKKIAAILLCALLAVNFAGCAKPAPQGAVPYDPDADGRLAREIRSGERGKVVPVGGPDPSFGLVSVTPADSARTITQEKYEIDIDCKADGNVYDPDQVDVNGQFVSPSGRVYEMPAFYYKDHERSLAALDETAEYPMSGYVAQGSVTLAGVIEPFDGGKRPVGKATFDSPAGTFSNAGAVLDMSGVNALHDGVSVWLKADADLVADSLYLGLYSSAGEAYAPIEGLTQDWRRYTFLWEDMTFNRPDGTAGALPLSGMYSGYVQTRGNAAEGSVFIADLQAVRSGFTASSADLATFISPELKYYRDGEYNGTEIIAPTEKAPCFKLRFRFDEPGEWVYRVRAEKNGEIRSTYTDAVEVTRNDDTEKNRGMIRVEPTQKRNFQFEDGTPYVALGHNLAYSVDPTRGSYDYEVYMPQMQAAGMNFIRVWLTYIGYGVQSTEGGILGFDLRQDRAYAMDKIIEKAEQYGLYMQIPLMTFSRFHKEGPNDDVEHRSWDSSPYNVQNGGYLDKPELFYTDPRAKEDTKKLYRYYIARWGYSRNILNWEIMNEIGESSDYDQTAAKAWAEEIGGYMHAADPFDHLVSLSSVQFLDEVYSADALDFTSIHSYVWGASYASDAAAVTTEVWKKFGKPVIIGEIGASGTSEELNLLTDPNGLVMRQTAWTAPMSGSAGGGMLWWWRQINDKKFYANITPARKFFDLLPASFITMENIGEGDVSFAADGAANVRALGFASNTAVYAYLYDLRYNYGLRNPSTFTASRVTFSGLDDGAYTVRVFDAQNGGVVSTSAVNAAGGSLTVDIGDWSLDVALLVEKS